MADDEKIYDSAAGEPDDAFWLAQGEKLAADSLPSVREAAKSMMTALAFVKAVYLGILGFADFVPKTAPPGATAFFTLPLLCWLAAIYFCVRVMMTKEYALQLRSPDDIREKSLDMLRTKQRDLKQAFWLLTAGLLLTVVLVVIRAYI